MSDLPASHYIHIYRTRIRSAEAGIAHPSQKILTQSRALLAELEKIDPKKSIVLEQISRTMVFKEADSQVVLGSLDYD